MYHKYTSTIPPATEYTLDRGEKCTQVAEPRWPPRSPRRVKAIVTAIESRSLGEIIDAPLPLHYYTRHDCGIGKERGSGPGGYFWLQPYMYVGTYVCNVYTTYILLQKKRQSVALTSTYIHLYMGRLASFSTDKDTN